MKKIVSLAISISLVLLVTGVSFAEAAGSDASAGAAIEKKVVSIDERINQLVAEKKTVDEITQALLTEGFSQTAIASVLVSAKLAANAVDADKIVGNNSEILGYTPPPGLAKDPAASQVKNVVLPPGAAGKNPNAGSFASPSTF
jgi:hypothetical protein